MADRHVNELAVGRGAASAHLFGPGANKSEAAAVVEHACFSPDGLSLVTVDRRRRNARAQRRSSSVTAQSDEARVDDQQLKFWTRASPTDEFVLHTRVTQPHSAAVTRLAYHPTVALAVSAGADGLVRVWLRKGGSRNDQQSQQQQQQQQQPQHVVSRTRSQAPGGVNAIWQCRATAEHRRGVAAADVAFSSDGSLMAVPYGASITLWSPFRVLLLRTFTYPSSRDTTVSSARFLPASTLLVAASDKAVHLWDVVAGHVLRTYRVGVASLAVHPTAPLFAVVTRLSSYTDDTTTTTTSASKSVNSSMDEDDDNNNDKKSKSKSSSSAHPLAVQHTLLFAPTSDRMPRCVRRTVVGFSKRQQTRADVHPPTELLSEVAFADGDGANVSSEALFGLSRGGVLSCIQPAVPRATHGAEESDASETNNDDVRTVDEPQSTVDYSVAYDKTIVKPKFINQLSCKQQNQFFF